MKAEIDEAGQHEFVIAHIRAAQVSLENMPCGGIGKDGATQADLDYSAQRGCCCHSGDYHQAQQAWLELQKAVEILKKHFF